MFSRKQTRKKTQNTLPYLFAVPAEFQTNVLCSWIYCLFIYLFINACLLEECWHHFFANQSQKKFQAYMLTYGTENFCKQGGIWYVPSLSL